MPEKSVQRNSRVPHLVVLVVTLLACMLAAACSGSEESSSKEKSTSATNTTTADTTTADTAAAEDSNLPAFARTLQPQIEESLDEMRVPGAIVLVDVPDQGTWSATFGTEDLATDEPMNPADHFRIGSITKTMTGTVILQLVDEGKLKLDDPVGKYRPGVPNGKHITIRQLLNMTSGLYSYSEDKGFNETLDNKPGKEWTPEELVRIGLKHKPDFAPGKGFQYSNTNTVLLGLIIEQITGNSLRQEYKERIFEPLGMSHTLLPAQSSTSIPEPYSHGYMYGTNVDALNSPIIEGKEATQANASAGKPKDVTNDSPSWAWAAGGVISTLDDLEIYVKALATGKFIPPPAAELTPKTQKERLTYVPASTSAGAAYGLAIVDFGGYIGHDGQLPGYNSFAAYNPDTGATIIVLTNVFAAPDGNTPATAIPKLIIKELADTEDEETTTESTGG